MAVKDIIALAQATAQVGFSFVVVWWLLTRHDRYLNVIIEIERQEIEILNSILRRRRVREQKE